MMCLLVDVVAKVQDPRLVVYHRLVSGSAFVVVTRLTLTCLTVRIAIANDGLQRLFFCDGGE